MSHLRRVAATLAATAVALTPSLLGSAHADGIPLPSEDSWYTTDAGNLANRPHGDVIAQRPVTATVSDLTHALAKPPTTLPPMTATQVLYRTRNASGGPSETVTTVLQPSGASQGVVAYLSYYDGLSDTCDPSYTLQDSTVNSSTLPEKAIIGTLLEQGYTVTIPDFEGETLDWAAGHEAGWSTLDAIKATEAQLNLPATTKVGMIGYSGGSIAGEWASELAPSYAPDLNIVGTAIGGVPVNLAHVMNYVDSSADKDRDKWVGVIPAAMASLARAYGDDFSDYLSTTGMADATAVSTQCIQAFAGNYPGVHVADLVKPGVDFLNEPDVKQIVSGLVMGDGHTPMSPMLMVQGNNDGIGDGVMVAADVKALATKYCRAGLPVQYNEMPGVAHGDVGTSFMLQGMSYLGQRFAGVAAQNNCAALTAPAPVVRSAIHAKLKSHSAGRKDVLVVTAKGATGAKVKVYRMHHGHRAKAGHGVINKHGKATIKVVDHNGSAKTRYRATVAATATTLAATTKVVKQR
jgi:hypothetical protein